MRIRLSTTDVVHLAVVHRAEVGGKAASLIRLGQGGFRVPDGIVLTTAFFAPWIRQIESSELWRTVVATVTTSHTRAPNLRERERLARACEDVKQFAVDLTFDAEQRDVVNEIRSELDNGKFAVRSSSPEEDLSGASFAGLYETVLNDTLETLDGVVRGPVKVLNDPFEKEVPAGDILVAVTTDPGWGAAVHQRRCRFARDLR